MFHFLRELGEEMVSTPPILPPPSPPNTVISGCAAWNCNSGLFAVSLRRKPEEVGRGQRALIWRELGSLEIVLNV